MHQQTRGAFCKQLINKKEIDLMGFVRGLSPEERFITTCRTSEVGRRNSAEQHGDRRCSHWASNHQPQQSEQKPKTISPCAAWTCTAVSFLCLSPSQQDAPPPRCGGPVFNLLFFEEVCLTFPSSLFSTSIFLP